MTDKRLVGPGLKGVTDKYSKEWLKKWIINSQEFIASGDEKAIAIYEEYNKQIMPAFYFSDEEFDAMDHKGDGVIRPYSTHLLNFLLCFVNFSCLCVCVPR